MRIIINIIAVYFVIGFLTFLDWELVWLKNIPNHGAWGRPCVTLVFGPMIIVGWPLQWYAFYELGTWSWWPCSSDFRT